MTGTIVTLSADLRTGTIRAQDGSRLVFGAPAVLGDFDALAVGHRVSFDVERGRPCYTAVRVFREPLRANSSRKGADEPADLRYTGFHQAANVRSYSFDAITGGFSVEHFVVTVDLALMLKHRIGVQEAPALCLRKLAADLKNSPVCERHQLGDDDLLAFASSRAAAIERKKARPPFSPRRGPAGETV